MDNLLFRSKSAPWQKADVLALHEQGLNLVAIARKLRISERSVGRLLAG